MWVVRVTSCSYVPAVNPNIVDEVMWGKKPLKCASKTHPTSRLHLTRFRPPSVSAPLLCSGGFPKNMRRHFDSFVSLSLSLTPSDCYRRTDHAVIRDYISIRGMMERILSHQTMAIVPFLSGCSRYPLKVIIVTKYKRYTGTGPLVL